METARLAAQEAESCRIAGLFADDRLAQAFAEREMAHRNAAADTALEIPVDPLLKRLKEDPAYLVWCSRYALSL